MAFTNILIPIDFSDHSVRALRQAIGLAREGGAKLTLMHVGVLPHVVASDYGLSGASSALLTQVGEQAAREQLHRLEGLAKAEIPESLGHANLLREGYPPREILDQVKQGGHDLVVLGTHGRTGLQRLLLGSVAERVVREAHVPVMVVP